MENALKFARPAVHVGAALSSGAPGAVGRRRRARDPARTTCPGSSTGCSCRGDDRTVPLGSGLGLAIVAELVAAMGGTVRAESPITRRWRDPDGRDPPARRRYVAGGLSVEVVVDDVVAVPGAVLLVVVEATEVLVVGVGGATQFGTVKGCAT